MPKRVLFVTGTQWVPAVGQELELTEQAPPLASHRQIDRQTIVPVIALQSRPGAQSAPVVQVCPSCLVWVAAGQVQST
jgi:hypothetical protein